MPELPQGLSNKYKFCSKQDKQCGDGTFVPRSIAYTSGYPVNDPKEYQAITRFRTVTGNIDCNDNIFGSDVDRGTTKRCFKTDVPADVVKLNNGTSTDMGDFVQCGTENDKDCTIPNNSNTNDIIYGVAGKWAYASGGPVVGCNNDTFGDPAPGAGKACYWRAPKVGAEYMEVTSEPEVVVKTTETTNSNMILYIVVIIVIAGLIYLIFFYKSESSSEQVGGTMFEHLVDALKS